MRRKLHEQLALTPARLDHRFAREWAEIDKLLCEAPRMEEALERVDRDLRRGCSAKTGRDGLSADQVLRILLVKTRGAYSYEELAFHTADSATLQRFCRIGLGDRPRKSSALHSNLSRLRPDTIAFVDQQILALAIAERFEDGSRVRGDCTVVETNIHDPKDSSLLVDCVRVLTRLLGHGDELVGGLATPWSNHNRRVRRRGLAISNVRSKTKRKELYRDALRVTRMTVAYAVAGAEELADWLPPNGDVGRLLAGLELSSELLRYVSLAERVIDQTERRVLLGKQVPAVEKIVSIFEPHTDIIVKSRRGTEYGHKILLTSGRSGLFLDSLVLAGNPADATLVDTLLTRHRERFGPPPVDLSLDGGFTSKANLALAKEHGVQNAVFHKKRGLREEDMADSPQRYRALVHFRAGIEAGISFLKRCMGLGRCLCRGLQSFQSWVKAGVLTANLLTLARLRLARDT